MSVSRVLLSCSPAGRCFSNSALPDASVTTMRGAFSCSSSRPLHFSSGSAPSMSNRPNLMLEEPALSTRTASDMSALHFRCGRVASVPGLARCCSGRAVRPDPVPDLRHVLAMLAHVARMLDQRVAELLLDVGGGYAEPRDALDRFDGEMEAIELVQDHHVEWRRGRAFLRKAAHMHAGVIGAVIGQSMDRTGHADAAPWAAASSDRPH